jgi:hypothetical protein
MLEKLGFSSTLFWVNTNTQMMFPAIGRLSEQFNQSERGKGVKSLNK